MTHHASAAHVQPFKPLTKEDVANILGITTRCVEIWVEQGLLPRWQKVGNRSLWHPDVFFGWLDGYLKAQIAEQSNEVSATPKPPVRARAKKADPAASGVHALNASRLERITKQAAMAATGPD